MEEYMGLVSEYLAEFWPAIIGVLTSCLYLIGLARRALARPRVVPTFSDVVEVHRDWENALVGYDGRQTVLHAKRGFFGQWKSAQYHHVLLHKIATRSQWRAYKKALNALYKQLRAEEAARDEQTRTMAWNQLSH